MTCILETNAFRILGLPADAEPREVHRREQKLQVILEMGSVQTDGGFSFAPSTDLSIEAVLAAVAKLDADASHIREELFWVHEFGGKLKIHDLQLEALLQALRSEQARNTTRGAVAAHNLAVVLTWQAVAAKGARRSEYWKDALLSWQRATRNPVFWQYMEDRASTISGAFEFDQPELERFVRSSLAELIITEIQNAIRERCERGLPELLNVASSHRDWLPVDNALKKCVDDVAGALASQMGPVLDEVGSLDKNTRADETRRILRSAEESIERISTSLQSALKPFGSWAGTEWTDLRSTGLKKLSVVYYNLLDDFDESLRLVIAARQSASGKDLLEQLDAGWRHVQQSIMVREAIRLMENGQCEVAEEKLRDALPLATEEQATHIAELQESCRYGRVVRGVDRTQTSPSLRTVNGVGTTFYGRRDWDATTRTYTTTQWLVALFIPLFPIASYKVSDTGPNSYRIYGRVPLSPLLSKYRWAVLAAIAMLIIAASVSNSSDTSGSRYTTSPTVASPASSSSSSQDAGASSDSVSSGRSTGGTSEPSAGYLSRYDEKSAIDVERAELESLSADLDRRKAQLDNESDSLDQLQARLRQIKSTYTEDSAPDDIRAEFNRIRDDYNRRVPAFNRALQQFKSDAERFEQRRLAFNERVQHYNANR